MSIQEETPRSDTSSVSPWAVSSSKEARYELASSAASAPEGKAAMKCGHSPHHPLEGRTHCPGESWPTGRLGMHFCTGHSQQQELLCLHTATASGTSGKTPYLKTSLQDVEIALYIGSASSSLKSINPQATEP